MAATVSVPEGVLILSEVTWNSSCLNLDVFIVWNSGFDDDSTSSACAVAGMYGVVNLKSSQFNIRFSCEVCLWNKTDIYVLIDQCHNEALFCVVGAHWDSKP